MRFSPVLWGSRRALTIPWGLLPGSCRSSMLAAVGGSLPMGGGLGASRVCGRRVLVGLQAGPCT